MIFRHTECIMQDAGAYPAIGSVLPMFGRIMASATTPSTAPTPRESRSSPTRHPSAPIGEPVAPRPRSLNESSTSTPPRSAWTRPGCAAGLPRQGRLPYVTQTGADMDTGDYEAALDRCSRSSMSIPGRSKPLGSTIQRGRCWGSAKRRMRRSPTP